MGKDRTSTIKLENDFLISIDKDHKGKFRGHQAIIVKNGKHQYRGWHYHVEHPKICQKSISNIIQLYLNIHMKISQRMMIDFQTEIAVGNVSKTPEYFAYYELYDMTCVLWIGKFDKLHIETNKIKPYAKGILNKETLKVIFNLVTLSSPYKCPNCNNLKLFTLGEPTTGNPIYFCPHCDYSIDDLSIESYYLAKAETGGY